MRIIALSATLPNLSDIGEWLNCRPECIHYFDDSFRPVPLQATTLLCGNMGNAFLFDRSLDNKVKDVVQRYSDNKQTLIFCSSKKNAESLALKLLNQNTVTCNHVNNQRVMQMLKSLQDVNLAQLISRGYAYHHAGIPPDDRGIVEQLFLTGFIRVLCSTSTLAHGVNLPAHLVIVKGTYSWRGSSRGYERLSRSDVIQMLGRAGRPGFDESGVAVVMTANEDREYYSNLNLSADVVESQLVHILPEIINAEISQTVIKTIDDALNWVKQTYYYIRVRKLKLNTFKGNPAELEAALNASMLGACTNVIKELSGAKLIRFNEQENKVFPNPESFIMSRNLTRFSSMKHLMSINPATTLSDLVKSLPNCIELHKPVRRTEKRTLNELTNVIRFPLKEKVQQPYHKCYILLQAAVNRTAIKDFSLKIEQAEIVDSAMRLLKTLHEICLENKYGPLLESAILFERALRIRAWEGNVTNMFQFCKGLSEATLLNIIQAGYKSVEQLFRCPIQQLSTMLNCTPNEANAIMHFTNEVYLSQMDIEPFIHDRTLEIVVKPIPERSRANFNVPSQIQFHLVAYHAASQVLFCYRKISNSTIENRFEVTLKDYVSLSSIKFVLLASNMVGIDKVIAATDQLPSDFDKSKTKDQVKQISPPLVSTNKSTKKKEAEPSLVKKYSPSVETNKYGYFDQFRYMEDSGVEKDESASNDLNILDLDQQTAIQGEDKKTHQSSQSSTPSSRTRSPNMKINLLRSKADELHLDIVPLKRVKVTPNATKKLQPHPQPNIGTKRYISQFFELSDDEYDERNVSKRTNSPSPEKENHSINRISKYDEVEEDKEKPLFEEIDFNDAFF